MMNLLESFKEISRVFRLFHTEILGKTIRMVEAEFQNQSTEPINFHKSRTFVRKDSQNFLIKDEEILSASIHIVINNPRG